MTAAARVIEHHTELSGRLRSRTTEVNHQRADYQ